MMRLKHLARFHGTCSSSHERPYVALEHVESWTGNLIGGVRLPVLTPASSGMMTAEPGDVLFGKLRPYLAKSWVVDRPILASTELICMRPKAGLDSRFLGYMMSTVPFVEWASATSDGMRMPRTSWKKIGEYRPWIPSQTRQCAIANYLDVETARIDALISKKCRMLELLDERSHALHDEWYERLSSAYGRVPIRRWSSDIEQGWSPICDSEPAEHYECGVIRTSAVSSGRFIGGNNKRLPVEIELNPRWLLRDGDLLVTRGSGTRSRVGRACVASVRGRILTLSDLVYRVRLIHAHPEFVSAALQSSPARAQIEASIRTDAGLTLKIRRDDLADVRIPAVPMDRQVSETANLTKCLMLLQDSKLRVEKQIALLTERRQALITAVVAGETPTSREVA